MYTFGNKSKKEIESCHSDMRKICHEVIKSVDFSALEGKREDKRQYDLFLDGKSKVNGRTNKSKHQTTIENPLSMALDVAPFPIDFSNNEKAKARFYMLAGYFFQVANTLHEKGDISHKLRWGGDWDSDKEFGDQSFDDLGHFELVKV